MKLIAHATLSKRPKGDLVVVPFFKSSKGAVPSSCPTDLKKEVTAILKEGDFSGKEGATMLAYLKGKSEKRLLLLGLGDAKTCAMEKLRKSYGAAMKRCQGKAWPRVHFILPTCVGLKKEEVVRAVSEGVTLSSYVYETWKSKENRKPFHIKTAVLVGTSDSGACKRALDILSGVNLTRDLVNGNALDVTPQTFVAEAKKLAKSFASVKAKIITKKELEKEKMNLLLAVGSSSRVDPALVIVEYRGAPRSKEKTMVVGKGITFDTGGLNIKPTGYMETMRGDMGGGGAVLGLIQAAAATKLKANIIGLVPTTENSIGSQSYKPGDVYRSHAGIAVEIVNTDAEGRLILADALSYGQKHFKPTRIIDIATLTGAVVMALGSVRAGLFSNNDKLAAQCEKAGESSGERLWRFPLDPEYRPLLQSDIADIKNTPGKRVAGGITSALFLQEFIKGKTPWVHLDIAGTAFLDKPEGYHLSQATGAGVRLLLELLECIG